MSAEPAIRYVLDLREPQSHLVRVTMTIREASSPTDIQFPAWNNLYQIHDFVRNVEELEARCDGLAQSLARLDLNTWQSARQPCSTLEVRYAVYAHDDSNFSSDLNQHHAYMNFALLLFYLPRERQRSVRVKFLLPAGWKLATLLDDQDGEFKAANYDSLVDSPAEAGEFQEYHYSQSGATYRLVVDADPADYSADRLLASLQKITATETALMRDVPFSRYTFILHFPRRGVGGGMEHKYGTAISVPVAGLRQSYELEDDVAHEFFHLWNVKRIRPQALEPIDYVHGNDTRDLWFCEGLTRTYTKLVLLRAGMITRQNFYQLLAAEIQELEERPARRFQSVEEAGREAWFEKYPEYLRPDRSISYYNKGALLGFLLDLSIRHASRNQHSLDDLMRRLNEDFARRARFFTQADLRALIAQLAPRFANLDEFFRDYLMGTRELDYDTYLGFAGLRLRSRTEERPVFGFVAVQNIGGPVLVESVEPGSGAERAGLERGDILLEANGQPLSGLPEDQLVGAKPGHKVKFRVLRKQRRLEVEYPLGSKHLTAYRVEEIKHPTPQQLQVREGWLEGKTEQ